MELKYVSEHIYFFDEGSLKRNGDTSTFIALDKQFERKVFIKATYVEGETPQKRNEALNRIVLEAKAMAKLEEHTCFTPRIYEAFYDKKSNVYYIVMQLIDGESLRQCLKTTQPLQMLDWMISLCDILSALENARLQNKDIKPENIMITKEGFLYLIDFGISIALPKRDTGTEAYRAPETRRGFREPGRDKVDIFSVGVMLYEFFCGAVPNYGQDYAMGPEIIKKEWKIFTEPKEKNPAIPLPINDIIVKCMKLRPKDRYASASALKYDLKNARREVFPRKSRR